MMISYDILYTFYLRKVIKKMKYFVNGLTEEKLHEEYKRLARKYHPDLNKHPDATRIMQEINKEYDEYFVQLRNNINPYYNASKDMENIYAEAKKTRDVIFTFLRRDKTGDNNKWFTFNIDGKVESKPNDPSFENFHGGFAVCHIEQTTEVVESRIAAYFGLKVQYTKVISQEVTRIPSYIEFPTYEDMYFGILYGGALQEYRGTSLIPQTYAALRESSIDESSLFTHIWSKNYGDIWIRQPSSFSKFPISYMKIGNKIMSCIFPIQSQYYEKLETIDGRDFGFAAFQRCTRNDFYEYFDVDWYPQFIDAVPFTQCTDFYWIEDPIVAHYARCGILKFFSANNNFRMRFGHFSSYTLENHLNETTEEDVDRIQTYLDELNDKFEIWIKGMIKKGKLKIKI